MIVAGLTGSIAMGKSEAGLVRKNDRLYVMPNKCARHSRFSLCMCGGMPERIPIGTDAKKCHQSVRRDVFMTSQ